ncbi:MAG: hypothetical protein ACK54P_15660 [Bacteroidota bacterium]
MFGKASSCGIRADTPLYRGTYYFTPIRLVPARYMLELFSTEPQETELYDYLCAHLRELVERYIAQRIAEGWVMEKREKIGMRKRGSSMFPSCVATGKFAYPERRVALEDMRHIQRIAYKRGKVPVRSYPCPHCREWYLTSQREYRQAG